MIFKLDLIDGSSVNLRFSMYFINRMCKLAEIPFTNVFEHLSKIANDLEVLAQILASAREAECAANGDFTRLTAIDGFEIMDKIPNFASSDTIWVEMGQMIAECLNPKSLTNQETVKKKAAPKKLNSRK